MKQAHYHCLYECENPQPFQMLRWMWCGRCWHIDGKLVECVLCTPETCPGDA